MVNDCSGPPLDSKSQTPKSQTPPTDHPYIRLYQYLNQQQSQPQQEGAPSDQQKKASGDKSAALMLESKNIPPTFSDWLNTPDNASLSVSVET